MQIKLNIYTIKLNIQEGENALHIMIGSLLKYKVSRQLYHAHPMVKIQYQTES